MSYDLHSKKRVYEANGVQEYIVWRTLEQQVDWFALDQGRYQPLVPDAQGIIRSAEFSGLWLHVPALLQGDMATVLSIIQHSPKSN